MRRLLIHAIAGKLAAMQNCIERGNVEWYDRHKDAIESLVREHMPSGSGFDNGTTLDFDRSNPERLVFVTSFHHMNDAGMYDGWTDHNVTCTASLVYGFDLKISGRNRRDIKDYISESFQTALNMEEPVNAQSV